MNKQKATKTAESAARPARPVTVKVGGPTDFAIGAKRPLALIAGPCVIESREGCFDLAKKLVALSRRLGIPYVFKASFDKANRSSVHSYRGPGIEEGLQILADIRNELGVPVVTDIHEPWQAAVAAKFVDVIQIPAFLCRQTDLLLAAGDTGCTVEVKKMQSMAPEDMEQVVGKIESTGNRKIILVERGTSFGYRNLVVDMRSLLVMREFGYPVVFDATHSVQRPGAMGASSGGDGRWAPRLACAAVATGAVDGVFIETHVDPPSALSDSANAIPLAAMSALWKKLAGIAAITRGGEKKRSTRA
ncbi:MAG: 3-deoxy-8-phosphooctulonate synthase [Kiritimatiellia bacterium]|jgi:2-dehydro-3-deoxyphosphooctonate aldolase (KDO 8-P synthase)